MKIKTKTWENQTGFMKLLLLLQGNFSFQDQIRILKKIAILWQNEIFCLCIKTFILSEELQYVRWVRSGMLHHILHHSPKPPLVSTNLQKFGGSVCQTKLPQHTQLQLITDSGPFAAVEGVRPLDLLRVPELLQPADHVLHHHQLGHWEMEATGNSWVIELSFFDLNRLNINRNASGKKKHA